MEPILKDIPHQFDTERLTIRCPMPGDGLALYEAVMDSLDEIRPWLPWAAETPTVEKTEANVRRGYLRFLSREDLWLLLFLKGSNTCIGGSGLHRIDWDVPKFEIGYWLRTSYVGQGFISEAVSGITEFAFETLGAKRVEIRCDATNKRSEAVARRLHFEYEGTLRQASRHHISGKLQDTLIFAKIAPED
ncbi:MAG: GNAT family N-acetyltransferase [Chloroflexi bacterium]|nr:MAG: GNAT family N-acetyltransferase [Chloroflexota bacterium]